MEEAHIRALVEVREAVLDVKASGGWPVRATGAEHEIIAEVTHAGERFDDSVIRTLKNFGLIFAGETTEKWFVHDLTPYGYELLEFLLEPSDASEN